MAYSAAAAACIHCNDSSSKILMNGWKCRTGEYAQLCRICYSIYKAGQFCDTFHRHERGWRDCNSCRKLIHCGCIVSLSDYSMDDVGSGIKCADCIRIFLLRHGLNDESNPQDLEMQSISTAPEPAVVLLFEKVMTATDVKHRGSRIVIPSKHAKAYFPEVSNGPGVILSILDTDGNEWRVHYHCWVLANGKVYVLQGLKDFMISNNLEAGNTVAFYMRKSDEKMIIELRKTSAVARTRKPTLQVSTASGK